MHFFLSIKTLCFGLIWRVVNQFSSVHFFFNMTSMLLFLQLMLLVGTCVVNCSLFTHNGQTLFIQKLMVQCRIVPEVIIISLLLFGMVMRTFSKYLATSILCIDVVILTEGFSLSIMKDLFCQFSSKNFNLAIRHIVIMLIYYDDIL